MIRIKAFVQRDHEKNRRVRERMGTLDVDLARKTINDLFDELELGVANEEFRSAIITIEL